jgi:ribosome-associated protein
VRTSFEIPAEELEFKASRSGGPGGQHVNTSSTRMEVRWNVFRTRALDAETKARVLNRLASRLDQEGWIRVVASDHRSQAQNRDAALRRLTALVDQARRVPKPRRPTKVPARERQERLQSKRQRGLTKQTRRRPAADD